MITVISGVNRKGSKTLKLAEKYFELFREKEQEVKLLALEEITHDWFTPDMYGSDTQNESLLAIQNENIIPAEKFVFVAPEYNGSIPGALKLFIDACSVWEYESSFKNKKALLVGLASGRTGNVRGLSHLAAILNHVGMLVMPKQKFYPQINKIMDNKGLITDEESSHAIRKHVEEFLAF